MRNSNLSSSVFISSVVVSIGILHLSILTQISPVTAQTAPISKRITNNLSTYENTTYGIKFQFPSNWNKAEILSGRLIIIEFVSPQNASNSSPPTHVEISIQKGLQNNTTLEQYTQHTYKALNTSLASISTLNVTKLQPTTLSGFPANGRLLNLKLPGAEPNILEVQVFTVTDNKAYTITYTADATKYFNYLPIFHVVLSSFQIMAPSK